MILVASPVFHEFETIILNLGSTQHHFCLLDFDSRNMKTITLKVIKQACLNVKSMLNHT